MRKKIKRTFILKYSVLLYLTAAAWYLLTAGEGRHAAVSFFKNMETVKTEQTSEVSTSTRFRYEKEFQNTLNRYGFFRSQYQADYSTAVPGLESTDILGESCNQMIPQGICVAGDYMLVTAYDNGAPAGNKTENRREVNPSVLYVLSNRNPESRQLLTTVVLPDINHVGGVAFDGTNIWIAKSTDRQCSVISYDTIQQAAGSGKSSYKLPEYDQNVSCGAVASFVTWHDNRLWVGTYGNRVSGMGMLRSYTVEKQMTEEGERFTLKKQEEIVIPGFANGVTFTEQGGVTCMAVSTSRGRYFHSNIYFYQVVKDCFTGKNLYCCYNTCSFPPMAEELVCDGETTYLLFESSATCYSTPAYLKCIYPVDRICAFSSSRLFWTNQRGILRRTVERAERMSVRFSWDKAYQERKYWQQYIAQTGI